MFGPGAPGALALRKFSEMYDYLDFWPLLATCHQDDMCEICRVVDVQHVWGDILGVCDLVWAKMRF